MTSLHPGLLAAICQSPDRDDLRLMYADAVDEAGDYWMARFIRISIERGHDEAQGEFAKVCERRMPGDTGAIFGLPAGWQVTCYRQLFELRTKVLSSPAQQPNMLGTALLTRGFVGEIACPCSVWLAHGPALVRCQPLESVNLSDKSPLDLVIVGQTGGRWWSLGRNDSPAPSSGGSMRYHLPVEIFEHLQGGESQWLGGCKDWPSLEEAKGALSPAALRWARAARLLAEASP